MKNRSFEVLCHKQIRNTRSMGSCSFYPNGNHSSFHPGRNSIWLPPHSTRMSHIRNSSVPPFHLDVSHPEFICAVIPPGCLTSGIHLRRHSIRIFCIRHLTPDGRGERFNFPGQTYPDPLIALIQRVSQPFCTVLRCSPKASKYLRLTF